MFGFFTRQSEASLTRRILRYRTAGSGQDGIHTLSSPKIDDLDYALMGADNSCARENFPDVSEGAHDGFRQLQWFAIKKGTELSKRSFGNSHGSSDDGGKTYFTETALLDIPKEQYQAAPEEVVWHHLRVTELRKQGVERADRIRMMTDERKSKPWLKSCAA
jgi:hypothetical protein